MQASKGENVLPGDAGKAMTPLPSQLTVGEERLLPHASRLKGGGVSGSRLPGVFGISKGPSIEIN